MTEVRLRDLGSLVPGRQRRQPTREDPTHESAAPPIPQHPAPIEADILVTPPPAATPPRAIFGDDKPAVRAAPEIDEALAPLAELAAHRATKGPLCIGLVGAPGVGKSFALARLSQRILDLSAAAARTQRAGADTPFLPAIHVQAIDAASLHDANPNSESVAHALTARLLAGLRTRAPALARDIEDAARDPLVALRDANDRLDALRRRLDTERRALDDAGSRRARLIETTLYDASGSQVDAYARANGTFIESRLNGFGFRGEAIRTYKTLVQLALKPDGKIGLGLRALCAFKGQTKLIGAMLVFVAAGLGLGVAIDHQATWTDSLRAGPKFGPWLADWFDAHAGLLASLQTAAFAAAALALLANVVRALRFLQPILKGARLLDRDLEHRRHDLDGLYAHQTKRVDTLQREVDHLTREVTTLERRVEGVGSNASRGSWHADLAGDAGPAERLFAAINATITATNAGSPQRIVVAIDHIDAISPSRARSLLDVLHRMSGPAILTLAGFDADQLAPEARQRVDLERWVHVPCRLDAPNVTANQGRLMHDALGRGEVSVNATLDTRRSALDDPFDESEADLLASLTDLAGRTPRAVRRFASLYTVARIGVAPHRGLLAVMMALTAGGTQEERRLVASALAGDPALPFDPPQAPPRLSAAFAEAIGLRERVTRGEAAGMLRLASMFSLAPPLLG